MMMIMLHSVRLASGSWSPLRSPHLLIITHLLLIIHDCSCHYLRPHWSAGFCWVVVLTLVSVAPTLFVNHIVSHYVSCFFLNVSILCTDPETLSECDWVTDFVKRSVLNLPVDLCLSPAWHLWQRSLWNCVTFFFFKEHLQMPYC